jgi:hypothetical protein
MQQLSHENYGQSSIFVPIKIRETKALEAGGLISNQTVATCAMIARMKSSVKVARHKMGCGKESAGGPPP